MPERSTDRGRSTKSSLQPWLKLVRTAAELALLLQDASKREISHADLLEEVFSRELAAKFAFYND